MSTDPLEALLEKLANADTGAAEQLYVTYEPILRKVVRRHLPARLRRKFDSTDVVQSIWADVLDGFRDAGWRFADAAHLQAFLVKVTLNRLSDRRRQHLPAAEREQPLAEKNPEQLPPSRQPQPSEEVRANEAWERLLALCPPEHHDVLRLRRQGFTLAEIGMRTGLHEGSVRRILRALARKFALAGKL